MSSVLTQSEQQTLIDSLSDISEILCRRLRPLVQSNSLPNVYESLTAAVYLTSSASNSEFVCRRRRRETFEKFGWSGQTQTVDDMVEGGFYCLGDADHVKCFFCDLGLKDCDVGDKPEVEHAKFSPLCFFLKASRGLEWLRRCSDRPPNYPTSYRRQDHNQLLRILFDHFNARQAKIATMLGFNETTVLLCISRRFIRFRKTYERKELVQDLQEEAEAAMGFSEGRLQQFSTERDLASVFTAFLQAIPAAH
jgi:hypothetical protein